MAQERKVVFASVAVVTMFVLSSAGGCSSGEDDEHLGKQSQALEAAARDGGCREVTLEASRSRREDDERGGEHGRDGQPCIYVRYRTEVLLIITYN